MLKSDTHFFAAILCGGGGKRLWPRSRLKKPKQFNRLFGRKTIFQETVARLLPMVPYQRILVITNHDYLAEVQNQVPGIPRKNIITEPLAKNTALAMGVATVYAASLDPQAVVANLPSDHLIRRPAVFRNALLRAAQAASQGDWLVTIGVNPQFPHTGLGYIHGREKWQEGILRVINFAEKPNLQKARQFLASKEYFWNAGIYIWQVESGLKAFKLYAPQTAKGLAKLAKSLGTSKEKSVLKSVYQQAPDISIDYAVSEKAKNMLVVPADFGWSDIGDWRVVYDLGKKDKNGNVIIQHGKKGGHLGIDTRNCLIHFDDELIATVGVENLIIIDDGNLILICHQSKSQDVKKIVEKLKESGQQEYL